MGNRKFEHRVRDARSDGTWPGAQVDGAGKRRVAAALLLLSCMNGCGSELDVPDEVGAVEATLSVRDARLLCAPYRGKNVIVGTDGNDVLEGTNKADCIVAGSGRDRINAGNGDDVVFAGDGDDVVHGGNGDDLLFGGAGDDDVSGDNGRDQLLLGPGNDYGRGNQGDDDVRGEEGADVLEGAQGADTLLGGACHDRIRGGGGQDRVQGGRGTDACDGRECELPADARACTRDADCGKKSRCVVASGVCVARDAEVCEGRAPNPPATDAGAADAGAHVAGDAAARDAGEGGTTADAGDGAVGDAGGRDASNPVDGGSDGGGDAGDAHDAAAGDAGAVGADGGAGADAGCGTASGADASSCPTAERVISASDPRIAGAALIVPSGAAPPEQAFTIALDEAVPPGGERHGKRTLGHAIAVNATGHSVFAFAESSACAKIRVPFERRWLNQIAPESRSTVSVAQLVDDVLVPVETEVRIDRTTLTAELCVAHLSTYVVTASNRCTPVELHGAMVENHPVGVLDVALEAPITFTIPWQIDSTGLGLLDFIFESPNEGRTTECRYRHTTQPKSFSFIACSDGAKPGETAVASRFRAGFEGSDDATFTVALSNEMVSCAEEKNQHCGLLPDNCGRSLNCADDGDPCTSDACDGAGAPTHTLLAAGTSCSDHDVCNGEEVCDSSGGCLRGVALPLDDGDPCTRDVCDPRSGPDHLQSFWEHCAQASQVSLPSCEGQFAVDEVQLSRCSSNYFQAVANARESLQADLMWAQFLECAQQLAFSCTAPVKAVSGTPSIQHALHIREHFEVPVCNLHAYYLARQHIIEDALRDQAKCAKSFNALSVARCVVNAVQGMLDKLAGTNEEYGLRAGEACCTPGPGPDLDRVKGCEQFEILAGMATSKRTNCQCNCLKNPGDREPAKCIVCADDADDETGEADCHLVCATTCDGL